MVSKTKSSIGRYWLLAPLLIVVVVGLFSLGPQQTKPTSHTLPARVIIGQARVIDQGVQVNWLEAQAGTYPIGGYMIERSRGNGDFERIARVEKISLEYLDSDGRAGDSYRIIAEDSHRPTGRSPASESVVAVPAKPGGTVVMAPSLPQKVLGALTVLDQASTPETKANVLQNFMIQGFIRFDTAIANKQDSSARTILNTLQDYHWQILSLWPQISSAQKKSLAQACAEQMGIFETNVHLLAERDQLDGLLVLAGCNAISEDV